MTERVDAALSETRIGREYERLRSALGEPVDLAGLEASDLAPEARAVAVEFWRARMDAEHRSVRVFAQVGLQLLDANAPHDAKTIMLRMAQDELLHTEICARVLGALGAEPAVESDVRVSPIATHEGCSRSEVALRNVIYTTCLSEMIAVGRLADSLETATHAAARSAIRAILADEVMHGQFGFLYLDALGPTLTDAARADLGHYLVHAFAVLEEELAPRGMERRPSPPADALALGVLDPRRAHEVFFGTVTHAIVPGLEARGVGAARAWKDRRRLA